MFTKTLKRRIAVSRNNLTPPPQYHQRHTENDTLNNFEFDSDIDRDMADYPQINRQDVSKLDLESKSHNFQVTPEETKMTNTFLLVVALFVICWAPFAITMFFDVCYPSPLPRAVDIASLLLGYLNSMCNPILYGLRNSALKQGFLKLYSRFLPERFRPTNVTLLERNPNASLGEVNGNAPHDVQEDGIIVMNILAKRCIYMHENEEEIACQF